MRRPGAPRSVDRVDPDRIDLYGLSRTDLEGRFGAWGLSPVHVARLWNYLYLAYAGSL